MSALSTAIEGLRRMIISGEIAPGDQFPNEVELSEKLGVSRSSLREAVQTLSAFGVIGSKHGSGRYLSDLDPASIIGGFQLTVDLVPLDGLIQMLDVRRILESYASGKAATAMSESDIQELRKLLVRMESATTLQEFQDYDNAFHALICGEADNPALSALSRVFRATGRAYGFSGEGLGELLKTSHQEHRQIVEAIARGDALAASGAASAHVGSTMALLSTHRPKIAEL